MANTASTVSNSIEAVTSRKVRVRLLPLLFVLYIVAFLDRVNIGFAALTMNRELAITSQQFGFAAVVFFFGYCLFEVPSNLLLHKIGARVWIARILLTWGIFATLTGFVHTMYVQARSEELVKTALAQVTATLEKRHRIRPGQPDDFAVRDLTEIAEVADFFSFGTNDLTQTVMGLSRDDAGRFLQDYVDEKKTGIFHGDPFQTLDVHGVGMLIRWGIEKGRKVRPKLEVGICGEHGGDADSVKFCHQVGMDYVSASPFRVPIARLAAAQAVVEEKQAKAKKKK